MGNDFRRIYGRRGPNSRTSSGVNLMRGYFIVQFYDDVKPELYVINDENTNVINNEIKSTSPLAKAVMDNKVGSAFFIEDYLERDLGTETGVSIIKKELEYIDYNPVLDGKTQYNYYYIKSYLDYVEPRKLEMKKEFNSNGKKVYIDLDFVSHDKLNKLINSLVKELNNRIKYDYTEISEKHKNDALLKIAKLEDMKDKNFYQEDLDYIKLDIEKYIFYEMSYYNTFDLYINNLIEDIKSDNDITNSSSIVRLLKKMLESDTIDENNEIYNKIYPKLEKIGKNYLPRFEIKYADFDFKPFDGYSIKKKKALSDIVDYYLEKYDKLCESKISLTHRKIIKKEINYKKREKYNSDLEYEVHLQQLFRCEAFLYKSFDDLGIKVLDILEQIKLSNYYELLKNKGNELLSSDNIEDALKIVKSIIRILKNYTVMTGNDGILVGLFSIESNSYFIEMNNIDQVIIFRHKTNCMNEHLELVDESYNNFIRTNNEDDSSYSMTSDEIIQDDFHYSQYREWRRDKAEEWKKDFNSNTSTSSVDIIHEDDDTKTKESDGDYRKTKDEIIQDDFHYSQYREWRRTRAEEWKKDFNSNKEKNHSDVTDIEPVGKKYSKEELKKEETIVYIILVCVVVVLLVFLAITRSASKNNNRNTERTTVLSKR